MRKEKTSQLMLQSHSLFYFLQISSHCSYLFRSLFLLPGPHVGATFSKSLQHPPFLNSSSLYFISWMLQHCPSTNRLPNTARKKTIPPLIAQNWIVVPASYAISPDHPQQMHFRFFKILSKNNKYKYKWRSAERTLPSKLPSTNRLRNKTHKKTVPPLFAQNACSYLLLRHFSRSSSTKAFPILHQKTQKSKNQNKIKKRREKNSTFQIKINKPIAKQDTRENETCSLDAKLHTPTSFYAISPDHPQRMHLGFFRILQQKNKRKMKPGRAKSITFRKDLEFPKTFKQLQILLVTIRIKLLQLPTERPIDFRRTSK